MKREGMSLMEIETLVIVVLIVVVFGGFISMTIVKVGDEDRTYNMVSRELETKSKELISKWSDNGKVDIIEREELISEVEQKGIDCEVIADISSENESTIVIKIKQEKTVGGIRKKIISANNK